MPNIVDFNRLSVWATKFKEKQKKREMAFNQSILRYCTYLSVFDGISNFETRLTLSKA